jgi:hypothetical protein
MTISVRSSTALVGRGMLALCMFAAADRSRAEATPFTYEPISEAIVSATFNADFGALTAHRTVGGIQVNMAILLGVGGRELDLSTALFGTADLLAGPAQLDQGALGTGIFSIPIDPSFFPAIAAGSVGLWAAFTDTSDGLFAIDFLSLEIVTATRTLSALMDANNGFGIGVPDGGPLPAALPISLPPGRTGTGFDESISSKSIHDEPIPEPASFVLFGTALLTGIARRQLIARRRRHRASSSPA